VDSSLAILIGGTAIFAGVVAYLVLLRDLGRRGAGVAAAAAASAVTASFVLMLYLATVATPAVAGLVALLTGGVAYMVFLRDLGRRRAALAAAEAAAAVTTSFLFVVYLAVIVFVGAVGIYLLARVRLRINAALIMAATTLSGLLAASALVFWISLTSVM